MVGKPAARAGDLTAHGSVSKQVFQPRAWFPVHLLPIPLIKTPQ
jgi:hypothetical protein